VALRYEDIETPNYIHIQRMYRRDTHETVDHPKSDDGDRQVYLTQYAKDIINTAREYQRDHGYDTEGYIFALDADKEKLFENALKPQKVPVRKPKQPSPGMSLSR